VKTAITSIHRDAGHIDVLVNNAGVERNGSVEELPLADFLAVMETNYFGPLHCIQAMAPQNAPTQPVETIIMDVWSADRK
jgi:NAD(P)-dependent dehydrogenase (short-subunit alcohol dehydrogenase family)